MATGAGGHGDQAVRTLLDGFVGKTVVDHIVQHDPAITVYRLVYHFLRTERGNDNGHLVLHAHFQIVLQTVVGAVHNLVHGKRCRGCVGVFCVPRRQFTRDFLQPDVELLRGPRIQGRE